MSSLDQNSFTTQNDFSAAAAALQNLYLENPNNLVLG